MAIGANWAEIWAPVWKAVWTQEAVEPEPTPAIQEIVPYLIGSMQAPAEAVIRSIYCLPSVVGSTGTVTAQDPNAFTYVDRGSTITITLGGLINSSANPRRRGQTPYNRIDRELPERALKQ